MQVHSTSSCLYEEVKVNSIKSASVGNIRNKQALPWGVYHAKGVQIQAGTPVDIRRISPQSFRSLYNGTIENCYRISRLDKTLKKLAACRLASFKHSIQASR